MPIKNTIAYFLHRIGISANALTVFGLLLAAFSGWLIFRGGFFWASAALLASGLIDLLDGAVARVSGKASVFGGIFDSSLDRYGDAFIYTGFFFHFTHIGRNDLAALAASAWIGAFLISYVRARAECEMDSCRVGFWERGERIGVLTLALALGNPAPAMWILGIGTHWTVAQRLFAASDSSRNRKAPTRADLAYFLKIGLLAGVLVFFRLS